MGLMDRIKKVTGTNDGYDDTYDDDYYSNFDSYDAVEEESDNGNGSAPYGSMDNGREREMGSSAPMGATGGISLSGQNIRMKIVRPKVFADGSQIARFLLNKCTVFLNLENTNKETARRLIDFLSGVAFSIDGALKKISANVYVITPNNVDVGDAQLRENRARQERERPAEKDPMADIDTGDLSDF